MARKNENRKTPKTPGETPIYVVRELAPAFIAAACRRTQQSSITTSCCKPLSNDSCLAGVAAGSRDENGGKPPHSTKRINRRFPKTIRSSSSEETHRIGIEIGKNLPIPGVVLLRGTLGMGKTTLTRGIADGLGLSDTYRVCSPSFTLVNIYQGRCPIYHVDLYRLSGARDLYSIGIDDFIGKDGVTIVEWSERLTGLFPGAVEIEITDAGGDSRILCVIDGKK